MRETASPAPRLIKRYAGARLYDTQAARYVDLDELANMVRAGEDVLVRDAATGDDLTGALLSQTRARNA